MLAGNSGLLQRAKPIQIGGVKQVGISAVREDAIIRLLDDDSPTVRAALTEELLRLDTAGLALLKKLKAGSNRFLAAHAQDYLDVLYGPNAVEDFVAFIRSLRYELETGCLLLNRTVFPGVSVAECCILLDAMAARCRELLILPGSAREQCKVLNRVIFHEYGFRGNVEDFNDPLNSMFSHVLQRRKGIPITLSIVYILAAQRCGLQLEPIGMPGRFMVGCFLDEEPFYIDAFERGTFRTRQDLRNFLRLHNIECRPDYFAPAAVGEVLTRCCRNLVRQFDDRKDAERVAIFTRFVNEFEIAYGRHVKR